MSNPRHSRYSEILVQIKLHTFETISTLIVLALLADFALKELHPIVRSIWTILRSP